MKKLIFLTIATFFFTLQAQACTKVNFYNKQKQFKASFDITLAKTKQEQEQGLMFVTKMPLNEGMLFIWEEMKEQYMWMKNTYISLDMVFIRGDKVAGIIHNTTPHSLEILTIKIPTDKVLELNAGIAKYYNLQIGDYMKCVS
jgi:uncharacterized membrane protein (UPF0127 family)